MPRLFEGPVTNRKEARYQLANLLTKGEFEFAALLSRRWLKYRVIEAEDYTFVEEIIRAATAANIKANQLRMSKP